MMGPYILSCLIYKRILVKTKLSTILYISFAFGTGYGLEHTGFASYFFQSLLDLFPECQVFHQKKIEFL